MVDREGAETMTGLEALQEEMLRRGCTMQQVKSKAVAVVLDILAKTPDKSPFEREWDLKHEQEELERKWVLYRTDKKYWEDESRRINEARSKLMEEQTKLRTKERELVDKIKAEFIAELEKCETSETRDRIRMAKLFQGLVDVDTKYDNTAYIIGLASILSGSDKPMNELKKMNPKLFKGGDGNA